MEALIQHDELTELAINTVNVELRVMLNANPFGDLDTDRLDDLNVTQVDLVFLSQQLEEGLGITFTKDAVKEFVLAKVIGDLVTVTATQLRSELTRYLRSELESWVNTRRQRVSAMA